MALDLEPNHFFAAFHPSNNPRNVSSTLVTVRGESLNRVYKHHKP
jgi:hypothetical protein